MESSGYNVLSSNKSNDSKNKTKSTGSLLSARPNNIPLAKRVDEDLPSYPNSTSKICSNQKNMTFNNKNNNTLEFSLGSTPNAKL